MNTSTLQRVMAAIALAAIASVLIALSAVRHDALDDLLAKHLRPLNTSSVQITISPSTSASDHVRAPQSQWDPDKRYLVYLPFEGISNQFYSFQNAAAMAKRLNRTLVVPPITSNRHDRLDTNQPWSHYMDLEHMATHSGIDLQEWQTIKPINKDLRKIAEEGSRTNHSKLWTAMAESLPCQVIRNYGHDHFVGEEDSIGADFAYQHLLRLKPIPVPGFELGEDVAAVDDIVNHNQDSTDPVLCFTFTFTAQFEAGHNRWDIAWGQAGQYARFLPRFASYVEDLISFRFGFLDSHIHPHPPFDLGNSILDHGFTSETFLSRKPPPKDYIAIHLRRGDIEIKCANRTTKDCIVPLSEYKAHVDTILSTLDPEDDPPPVVLVSDTRSDTEKAEIDSYGWYRLDHTLDPNLIDAATVLGPFSAAIIDSAVLTGRGARWVIGSRRSTMSWLAAMRLSSWYNNTIIYPKISEQGPTHHSKQNTKKKSKKKKSKKAEKRAFALPCQDDEDLHPEDDSAYSDDRIVTWDRYERHFFDHL